jgi:hypothetical protein
MAFSIYEMGIIVALAVLAAAYVEPMLPLPNLNMGG